MKQILGLGSYYRRFVKDYSDLVKPLTHLTNKDVQFIWSKECQQAFDNLKEKLIGADIMAYPQHDGLYILDTDASNYQIGSVLSQIQDGKERVISYGSRTLNKAEKNYCITDKELLAIRHFVEYYRQYLLGRQFLVRSDHQALTYLFRLKEPKGRIARWIEILSAYNFTIEYRAGNKHGNADALSRCPNPWDCQCSDVDNLEPLKCGPCNKCSKRSQDMMGPTFLQPLETENTEVTTDTIRAVTTRSQAFDLGDDELMNQWTSQYDPTKLQELQREDTDLNCIIRALIDNVRPAHSEVVAKSPTVRYYWSIWSSLFIRNGCLYRHFYRKDGSGSYIQFLVPRSLKKDILYQMHNSVLSGHLGRKKTLEKTLQRFYWFGIREDVKIWVKKCDTCASIKTPNKHPRAALGKMPVGAPLDRLATDILGPLPLTPRGNRYILLVTDHFTKWVEVFPVPDQTAETCANKILNEVISRFGCSMTIHSDQGRNYESKIFSELCRLLEIKKTRTSARNPKCNGVAERFNRTLLRMIKSYLRGEQDNWDMNLGCLAAAYRASPHESSGLTPNLLMLGREVRLPAELMYGGQNLSSDSISSYGEYVDKLRDQLQLAHTIARKHLATSAKRQSEIYDSHLSIFNFKPKDLVWVENHSFKPSQSKKLQPAYEGPCIITKKYNDLTYKVMLSEHTVKVLNHNKMKPYEGEHLPIWIKKQLKQ